MKRNVIYTVLISSVVLGALNINTNNIKANASKISSTFMFNTKQLDVKKQGINIFNKVPVTGSKAKALSNTTKLKNHVFIATKGAKTNNGKEFWYVQNTGGTVKGWADRVAFKNSAKFAIKKRETLKSNPAIKNTFRIKASGKGDFWKQIPTTVVKAQKYSPLTKYKGRDFIVTETRQLTSGQKYFLLESLTGTFKAWTWGGYIEESPYRVLYKPDSKGNSWKLHEVDDKFDAKLTNNLAGALWSAPYGTEINAKRNYELKDLDKNVPLNVTKRMYLKNGNEFIYATTADGKAKGWIWDGYLQKDTRREDMRKTLAKILEDAKGKLTSSALAEVQEDADVIAKEIEVNNWYKLGLDDKLTDLQKLVDSYLTKDVLDDYTNQLNKIKDGVTSDVYVSAKEITEFNTKAEVINGLIGKGKKADEQKIKDLLDDLQKYKDGMYTKAQQEANAKKVNDLKDAVNKDDYLSEDAYNNYIKEIDDAVSKVNNTSELSEDDLQQILDDLAKSKDDLVTKDEATDILGKIDDFKNLNADDYVNNDALTNLKNDAQKLEDGLKDGSIGKADANSALDDLGKAKDDLYTKADQSTYLGRLKDLKAEFNEDLYVNADEIAGVHKRFDDIESIINDVNATNVEELLNTKYSELLAYELTMYTKSAKSNAQDYLKYSLPDLKVDDFMDSDASTKAKNDIDALTKVVDDSTTKDDIKDLYKKVADINNYINSLYTKDQYSLYKGWLDAIDGQATEGYFANSAEYAKYQSLHDDVSAKIKGETYYNKKTLDGYMTDFIDAFDALYTKEDFDNYVNQLEPMKGLVTEGNFPVKSERDHFNYLYETALSKIKANKPSDAEFESITSTLTKYMDSMTSNTDLSDYQDMIGSYISNLSTTYYANSEVANAEIKQKALDFKATLSDSERLTPASIQRKLDGITSWAKGRFYTSNQKELDLARFDGLAEILNEDGKYNHSKTWQSYIDSINTNKATINSATYLTDVTNLDNNYFLLNDRIGFLMTKEMQDDYLAKISTLHFTYNNGSSAFVSSDAYTMLCNLINNVNKGVYDGILRQGQVEDMLAQINTYIPQVLTKVQHDDFVKQVTDLSDLLEDSSKYADADAYAKVKADADALKTKMTNLTQLAGDGSEQKSIDDLADEINNLVTSEYRDTWLSKLNPYGKMKGTDFADSTKAQGFIDSINGYINTLNSGKKLSSDDASNANILMQILAGMYTSSERTSDMKPLATYITNIKETYVVDDTYNSAMKILTDAKAKASTTTNKDSVLKIVNDATASVDALTPKMHTLAEQADLKAKLQTCKTNLGLATTGTYVQDVQDRLDAMYTKINNILDSNDIVTSTEVSEIEADVKDLISDMLAEDAKVDDYKTELKYVIDESGLIYSSDVNLTDDDAKWTDFQDAITKAQGILAKSNDSGELANEIKTLKQAYLEVHDRDALRDLIKECSNYEQGDYSQNSWDNFTKKLVDAQNVNEQWDASQTDINLAVYYLNQVKGKLVNLEQLEQDIEADTLKRINEYRVNYVFTSGAKLSALKPDAKMLEAAQIRAKELVQSYEHTRPDGTSFATVGKEVGLTGKMLASENIAMETNFNASSLKQYLGEYLFEAWKASPSHNDAMLSTAVWGEVGVHLTENPDGSLNIYSSTLFAV